MNTLSFHFFPGRHAPTFVPLFDTVPDYSKTGEPEEEQLECPDDPKTRDRLMTISGSSAQYLIPLPPVSDDRCA
jgi:hypothetical protein